jgi:hypothetical protein
MKKLRLLLAALLLCAGFSAQAQNVDQTSDAVLDIPTTGDYQLDPKDATIKMVTSAYVNFKEDGVTQFVEPQRYKGTGVYNEDNTVQYNQFDNMYNKDWVQFKLRNTAEKAYIIRFQTACKKDGSQVKFELKSGDDTDLDYTYNVPNTGNWGRWQDGVIFISDPIEMGDKTLTITFLNEDGTTTANLRNLRFEGVDGTIETSSLYTYKYVGDTENEACGTIAISPLQDVYVNGSEVTLTATPAMGYKFVKWVDQYDDEYTDNPLKYTISESTDLSAYFEEVEMGNAVPGTIDLETRSYRANGKIQEKNGVKYLGDYRNGQKEQFQLIVKKDADYTLSFRAATKEDAPSLKIVITDATDESKVELEKEVTIAKTGKWDSFPDETTKKVEGVHLTAGSKIMTITFQEPEKAKYTVNLTDITFTDSSDPTGIKTVETTSDESSKAYNLMGIEVNPATAEGIIIVNGKKIVK